MAVFRSPRTPLVSRAALLIVTLVLAGCGASTAGGGANGNGGGANGNGGGANGNGGGANGNGAAKGNGDSVSPHARPQAVEPTAGQVPVEVTPDGSSTTPIGDPNAHAPPLSEVKQLLQQELVAAPPTSAGYINPLHYVSVWERTDQGVDAVLPVGAPILAPGAVKILAVIPNWYAGQPLVYWELLNGPDAGKIQYVAEEITDIAKPGSYLQQGQPIARFAASGTGIEFGWSTTNGVTLAMATTGYEEGVATPAGNSIRAWLNSLGANAGPGHG